MNIINQIDKIEQTRLFKSIQLDAYRSVVQWKTTNFSGSQHILFYREFCKMACTILNNKDVQLHKANGLENPPFRFRPTLISNS